ncbi:sulfite exporter TauE/SafE family protein [Nocardiopsis alkaliphila]|uniref:sulfite exporter TauE/SafE family protein n=1 Tax=Nocardiopsis alkaliphila TaxID=225762 RepID=UPI0003492593|nr:sulfite exporter TauE/SafE family protein [Nocardiopsis alkaliphila]
MEFSLILTVGLAVLVGLTLGLLGGGGSILMVPLLTYVAGMEPREAIATSLFVVGVTSLTGVVTHARAGNVRWRTGLVFGAAGMVGAFLGGLLGGHLPGTLLMVAFALMMVATAVAMMRAKKKPAAGTKEGRDAIDLRRAVLDGLVVGAVTGLVGAGGGFLVVPALALLGGLAMPAAVGTSLLVIAMKSFAGLTGYMASVSLDWPMVLMITGAAVAGSLLGALLTSHVPEAVLRQGFGVFVLAMGVLVLALELPSPFGPALAVIGAALAGLVLLCRLLVEHCPLRPLRTQSRG